MRFLDSIGEAYIRNQALGCARNVVGSRSSWERNVLQTSNEFVVVGELIVRKGSWCDKSLYVQIETINGGVAEWTRFASVNPSGCAWAKGTPQEVGEVFCNLDGWQGIVDGIASSDGKQHLLAVGLTFLDSGTDGRTV